MIIEPVKAFTRNFDLIAERKSVIFHLRELAKARPCHGLHIQKHSGGPRLCDVSENGSVICIVEGRPNVGPETLTNRRKLEGLLKLQGLRAPQPEILRPQAGDPALFVKHWVGGWGGSKASTTELVVSIRSGHFLECFQSTLQTLTAGIRHGQVPGGFQGTH